MTQDYPILEFDSDPQALLEPHNLLQPIDIPPHVVICFFQDVITQLVQKQQAQIIYRLRSELGPHPIYEIAFEGKRLAIVHPGVGAPLGAGILEETIALGASKFIACGGAGVLDNTLAVGHAIVPTSAIRDEGTSYHYLPPGREVMASQIGIEALENVLHKHHCEYVLGKTWTTDALYRETPLKVKRRRQEGCLTVEMEAAAFFAVAQFRHVEFAQILYGGDDLGSETWSSRDWTKQTSVREKLFWLAAEACLQM